MAAREKLRALVGMMPARCVWLSIPSPVVAEIAAIARPEIAVIDTEHGAIGMETLGNMLRAVQANGTGALVRVTELNPGLIKRALDAGADGVLVPRIESIGEAERAVEAALYPPRGRRGFAGVVRANAYGERPEDFRTWNDRGILAVQIESHEGLTNASDIAGVEGIDMLFFGPFDYARETGLDPTTDGEVLHEVLERIVAAAREAGKLVGVFPWPGAAPRELAAAGGDLVVVGADTRVLVSGFKSAVQTTSLSMDAGS